MLSTEDNDDEINSNTTEISQTANVILPLSPSVPSTSSSSTELSVFGDSDIYWETHIQHPSGVTIPIKPTLKELLNAANGSNDVENMTSVKLCVISSEMCLQHISVHTPNLTELILDGSVISSLRDLGCNLKKLKVLRVNRCHLTSLDGTFGLQELEELHAGHNSITSLNPCAYLPVVRHIDLNNNCLKNISMLSFLNICKDLETLVLAGNTDIVNTPDYRKSVKLLVKNLKNLDGEQLEEIPKDDKNSIGNEENTTDCVPLEFNNNEPSISLIKKTVKQRPSSSRKLNSPKEPISQFSVRFPPKVLSPRLPVPNTKELKSASNSAKSKPKKETHLCLLPPQSSFSKTELASVGLHQF